MYVYMCIFLLISLYGFAVETQIVDCKWQLLISYLLVTGADNTLLGFGFMLTVRFLNVPRSIKLYITVKVVNS